MATRRRVDDSDEEEATAIDLRQSSKSAAPGAGARKPAAPAPPVGVLPRKSAPIVDDDDDDATEFLSVRPRPAPGAATPGMRPSMTAAGSPSTSPPMLPGDAVQGRSGPGAAPPPRSVPSAPSEPALRARGRAVPLGTAADEAPSAERSTTPAPSPPAPPASSPPGAPQGRPSRDSTEPLVDVENLPRAPRPLPGNTATSPVGFPANARHPPIEESTTGSHAGTASIPRITRIHVISDTGSGSEATNGDDDDERGEATLPPNSPEARKLGAVARAAEKAGSDRAGSDRAGSDRAGSDRAGSDRAGSDRAASDKAGLDKARVDDARPLEAARIRKVATVVQNLDDETQAPEGSESTQAAGSSGDDVKGHRPVPATADSEDGRAVVGTHDGTLVVEAPADAAVVVNGIERGKGVVRVTDLDRLARHNVRIHAPGFQPWSGSVTLEGKPAAKIRPTLKPRAR